MFKIRPEKIIYSAEPELSNEYTDKMDKIYTNYAVYYELFIKLFPLWKKWIGSVLDFVQGDNILDVSFGPGYLFSKYPPSKKLFGLDYNATVIERAKIKYPNVYLTRGNVESMPYEDNTFDTVVNTMSFSGYPDGEAAINEMLRVLKDDGVILLMDYDYPDDRNIFGYLLVKVIEKSGNIIRDLDSLFTAMNLDYEKKTIGGFSSINLYIIKKRA